MDQNFCFLKKIIIQAMVQMQMGINNQMNTTINLNQYMIRHLPIKEPNNEIKSNISSKVDSIISLFKQKDHNKRKVLEIQKEIDEFIMRIFLINSKEKQLILKSI